MKSILLVFTFLFSLTATAQVDFPYKRPELLVGETVTIKPIDQYAQAQQYRNFYAGKDLTAKYKGKWEAPNEALEGRKFEVTAIEPFSKEPGLETYWLTLKDTQSPEVIYYLYSDKRQDNDEYYFGVEAGLVLPPDFYCDYITEMKMPDATSRYTINQTGYEVVRSGSNIKPVYTISVKLFESQDQKTGPLTFILDNGSRVVVKNAGIYNVSGRTYVGADISATNLQALTRLKPVAVEYGGKQQVLFSGEILQNASACLLGKN